MACRSSSVVATLLGVGLAIIPTSPGLTQAAPSSAQCTDLLAKLARGISLSAAELALVRQCPRAPWAQPDPNAPLPTTLDCIHFLHASLTALGQNNSRELEGIPQEKLRSLSRCRQVVETRYMSAASMRPALETNDRLLVDKLAYRDRAPQRGDIVLFQPTKTLRQQNFQDPFVKRIIGLPGETVEVKQGAVYINGQRLQESDILEPPQYTYGPVKLPPNQYYVMGDNRNNSYDSHYWGFVPRELISGRVIAIFCPVKRQQILSQTTMGNQEKTALQKLFQVVSPICKTANLGGQQR